jgi:hypothetical protein
MGVSGVASSCGLHAISGVSYGVPPQQKMSNLFDAIETCDEAHEFPVTRV